MPPIGAHFALFLAAMCRPPPGVVPKLCHVAGTLVTLEGDCLSQGSRLSALPTRDYMPMMVDHCRNSMSLNWSGLLVVLVLSPGCGGQVVWAVEGSGGTDSGDVDSGDSAVDVPSSGGAGAVDPGLEAARVACQLAIESGVIQPTTDRVWSQEICALCPDAILACANEELHWCVPRCPTGLSKCECSEAALCVDQVRVAHGFLALCASF